MIYYLIPAAAASVLYFIIRKTASSGGSRLRKNCLREMRLPRAEAEKTLKRHIRALEKKHPGKDENWYLEKILYDIQRDRN
jgi:hypothetical protein